MWCAPGEELGSKIKSVKPAAVEAQIDSLKRNGLPTIYPAPFHIWIVRWSAESYWMLQEESLCSDYSDLHPSIIICHIFIHVSSLHADFLSSYLFVCHMYVRHMYDIYKMALYSLTRVCLHTVYLYSHYSIFCANILQYSINVYSSTSTPYYQVLRYSGVLRILRVLVTQSY